jgi:hypothetical protein
MPTTLRNTDILFNDNTTQNTAAIRTNANFNIFAASGTWVCPAGVTRVRAIVVGGGGGSNINSGNRGNSGGVAVGIFTVVPGTSYAITVGAGSAGSTSNVNVGSGGTSSFASFCSATGGVGGRQSSSGDTANQGAGSGGNISNTAAMVLPRANIPAFAGADLRRPLTNADIAGALTWSTTSGFTPGACGISGNFSTSYAVIIRVAGAVGGAVLLEFIN